MRVDHRRADIRMAQQFLHGSNIVSGFQQMGRETVAKTVAGGFFADAGTFDGGGDFASDGAFMGVMSAFASGAWVDGKIGGGEDELPFPFAVGIGEFAGQGTGHLDAAEAAGEVFLLEDADFLQVLLQFGLERFGEHGAAVFVALAFADGDFVSFEVEVLDAQAEAFEKAHAGAVEQLGDEEIGVGQLGEEKSNFGLGEDDGET